MRDGKAVGRSANRFQACARGCRLCAASKDSALLRWSRQKGRRHTHTHACSSSPAPPSLLSPKSVPSWPQPRKKTCTASYCFFRRNATTSVLFRSLHAHARETGRPGRRPGSDPVVLQRVPLHHLVPSVFPPTLVQGLVRTPALVVNAVYQNVTRADHLGHRPGRYVCVWHPLARA